MAIEDLEKEQQTLETAVTASGRKLDQLAEAVRTVAKAELPPFYDEQVRRIVASKAHEINEGSQSALKACKADIQQFKANLPALTACNTTRSMAA